MTEPANILANPAQLRGAATVRRVVVNTMSLLTSDILNKAATFAVYVLVARYTGPRSFGQLSLGLMLLYTFQVFASAGLPVLITREVARCPSSSGRYFANASMIVSAAFFLSLVALFGLVTVSRYPADTAKVILLLGAGILPWSLTMVANAVLQAWEKMHFIVLVAVPVNVAKVGLAYYLLRTGHGVDSLALVFLACHTATLLLVWPVVFRHIHWRDAKIELSFCRDLLRRTSKFLGIDSLLAVWASTNTVLLSWFAGETAVGVFAAAWQLLIPVSMTFQAIVQGLFPIMCRRANENRQRFRELTVLLFEILAIIAVPGCILLYFGAGAIISLVYGNKDFASSVLVMRIMLPVLLLQAVALTFGHVLFSQRQEHVTLRIVAIDTAFNALCGIVLIYYFGLLGAAVTVLLTWIINTYLHAMATREWLLDENGSGLLWHTTLLGKVLTAGCIMAGALALSTSFNFIATSLITSLLYVVVLAVLVLAACGGPLGLRERFLMPLREP
jgi:O-antigen/teichoic acid export membrane protein